jgi:hypothetical protein
MKKQVIIIAIVIFLISAGLTLVMYNPFNIDKNKFIGTWKSFEKTSSDNVSEYIYEFFSDGKMSRTKLGNGTWDIEYGKLVITLDDKTSDTYKWAFTYQFLNNDRTLSITFVGGGTTFILTKQ